MLFKRSVDFDLRQLEIFCAVVEHASFSRAAKAVGLAQASVSERIAGLEEIVGARLLDRLGRKVLPTPVGQLLYQRGQDLLRERSRIVEELGETLAQRRGVVSVGASTIPGEYILPAIIARFRADEPLVTLDLLIADSVRTSERVAAGEVEIGFVGQPGSSRELDYSELWQDDLALIVGAGHPWAKQRSIAPQKLQGAALVVRPRGSGTQDNFDEQLRGLLGTRRTPYDVVARLSSTTAVKQAVIEGLGAAIVSRRAIAQERAAGLLVALDIRGLTLRRHFYLVRDRRRSLSPAASAFVAAAHIARTQVAG